jgi:hypothetical protein
MDGSEDQGGGEYGLQTVVHWKRMKQKWCMYLN